MSAVRVRVVLGELNLFFEGQEAFFTEHIQPLLEGAYCTLGDDSGISLEPESEPESAAETEHVVQDVADPIAEPIAAPERSEAPENATPPQMEAPAAAEPSAVVPADGFRPASRQFSSFVKRVGSRAPKPDQQVMAFAFYLWNYERRASFQADELVGCFLALALPVPEPMAQRLEALCTRKRFLAPHVQSGGFELTPKGVNYVKNRLLVDA